MFRVVVLGWESRTLVDVNIIVTMCSTCLWKYIFVSCSLLKRIHVQMHKLMYVCPSGRIVVFSLCPPRQWGVGVWGGLGGVRWVWLVWLVWCPTNFAWRVTSVVTSYKCHFLIHVASQLIGIYRICICTYVYILYAYVCVWTTSSSARTLALISFRSSVFEMKEFADSFVSCSCNWR